MLKWIFEDNSLRNSLILILLLFLFGSFVRILSLEQGWSRISPSVFAYLGNFLVGIILALIWLKYPVYMKTKNFFWDLFLIISIYAQFYFYKPQADIVNQIGFNSAVFVFFLAVFKGRYMNKLFTLRVVYVIGGMCYSIYLLHYAYLHLCMQYTYNINIFNSYSLNLLVQAFLCLPQILFVSGLFYWFFERPFMSRNCNTRKVN